MVEDERWGWGAGRAQWLGVSAALAEHLGSGPSTHIRQLTIACNSESRGSKVRSPGDLAPADIPLPHARVNKINQILQKWKVLSNRRDTVCSQTVQYGK